MLIDVGYVLSDLLFAWLKLLEMKNTLISLIVLQATGSILSAHFIVLDRLLAKQLLIDDLVCVSAKLFCSRDLLKISGNFSMWMLIRIIMSLICFRKKAISLFAMLLFAVCIAMVVVGALVPGRTASNYNQLPVRYGLDVRVTFLLLTKLMNWIVVFQS